MAGMSTASHTTCRYRFTLRYYCLCAMLLYAMLRRCDASRGRVTLPLAGFIRYAMPPRYYMMLVFASRAIRHTAPLLFAAADARYGADDACCRYAAT